ncbi:hypothetical protein BS78_01G402200 [Paspalum vaginatum]|nr:hypothetical protein BS78_01G402200 [Paspalum vaginatum]
MEPTGLVSACELKGARLAVMVALMSLLPEDMGSEALCFHICISLVHSLAQCMHIQGGRERESDMKIRSGWSVCVS